MVSLGKSPSPPLQIAWGGVGVRNVNYMRYFEVFLGIIQKRCLVVFWAFTSDSKEGTGTSVL